MDRETDFYTQLEILAQLPSSEGKNRAVSGIFGVMKGLMTQDERSRFESLLPEWLQEVWSSAEKPREDRLDEDILTSIKAKCNYAYRGAAERSLRGVLGSLIEILDLPKKEEMRQCLPRELFPFWNQAASCSLSETMGQFL